MSEKAHQDLIELKRIWNSGRPDPIMQFLSAHKREPKPAAVEQFRFEKATQLR